MLLLAASRRRLNRMQIHLLLFALTASRLIFQLQRWRPLGLRLARWRQRFLPAALVLLG
jgi:hypothetical protein